MGSINVNVSDYRWTPKCLISCDLAQSGRNLCCLHQHIIMGSCHAEASSGIYGQRRPRSACAFALSANRIIRYYRMFKKWEQIPGWEFAHVQDDVNPPFLCMFEGTVSYDVVHITILQESANKPRMPISASANARSGRNLNSLSAVNISCGYIYIYIYIYIILISRHIQRRSYAFVRSRMMLWWLWWWWWL